MQAISKVLFSSYRRAIAVYLICIQGIAVAIVLANLPSVFPDPLAIMVLLFVEMLVILFTTLYARDREKTLRGPSLTSSLQQLVRHQMNSLCLEEISELSSKSPTAGSASIHDLLAFLDRDNPVEWIVERFIELSVSKKCIDALLWRNFFDRFEETTLHRPKISWFSRKDFQKYRASRGHLLSRDDETSQVFRESLSRWSMQASGLE